MAGLPESDRGSLPEVQSETAEPPPSPEKAEDQSTSMDAWKTVGQILLLHGVLYLFLVRNIHPKKLCKILRHIRHTMTYTNRFNRRVSIYHPC